MIDYSAMTLGYDDIGQPKSIIDLRPLDIADLLDSTIKVYRRNPLTFIGVLAILTSVPMVINQAFFVQASSIYWQFFNATMSGADPGQAFNSMIDQSFIVFAIIEGAAMLCLFFLSPLAQGAIVYAISETILGRPTSISESLSKVMKSEKATNIIVAYFLWGVIVIGLIVLIYGLGILSIFLLVGPSGRGFGASSILFSLLALFGMLILFGLYFFLTVKFLFLPQAVMLDNTSAVDALKRSYNLTTGYWWRVLGFWILIAFIVGMIQNLLGLGFQLIDFILSSIKTIPAYVPIAIGGVFLTIITLVTQPLVTIAQTLIYYDLRIRKEGFDLLVLAASMSEDGQ